MKYYKLNYDYLSNLRILKMWIVVLFIIVFFTIIIVMANRITILKTYKNYGFVKDNYLNLKIDQKSTDKIKNSEYFVFNNKRYDVTEIVFDDYEIINDDIYINTKILIDNALENEFGKIKFVYKKEKIIDFIFELFK